MPIPVPLTGDQVQAAKELIAEVVLEFYSDSEFLPKTKAALLLHYEKTGYLDDLTRFATVYAKENGAFLILKNTAGLIGCGGLSRLDGSKGELARLWMRKEFRGRGLGRIIFDRLMRTAQALGYGEVFLDTSHRCEAAVALFRKNGFSECPPYKESLGDLFMRKSLA
ncbi:MAG: GNAT family N-acetyltransferase [Fibrobacteria bacterium]